MSQVTTSSAGISVAQAKIRALALGSRFRFLQCTLDAAMAASAAEAEQLKRRADVYLTVILRDLLQSELPANVYDSVEHIIEVFIPDIHAAFSLPATAGFDLGFGLLCYVKCYDGLALAIKGCLEDVFNAVRAAAMAVPRGLYHPSLILADDPLAVLLRRLQVFCDDLVEQPRLLSLLRPALTAKNTALSKVGRSRFQSAMAAAAQDAKGDLAAFLGTVCNQEIQTNGYYPCVWRSLSTDGWGAISDATIAARGFYLRHREAVLRTFVGKIIEQALERRLAESESQLVSNSDVEVLVTTLISNEGLLHLLHCLGVYQDVPGCPFEGMASDLPAKALKIFIAVSLSTTGPGKKDDMMSGLVRRLFCPTEDILARAFYAFHRLESAASIPDEGTSPAKRRRILAPVQETTAAPAPANTSQEPAKDPAPALAPSTPPRVTTAARKTPPKAKVMTPRTSELYTAHRRSVPGRTTIPEIKLSTTPRLQRETSATDALLNSDLSEPFLFLTAQAPIIGHHGPLPSFA
ncbi:hypothetical protein MVEN_02205800 [Mycena venus]|uniref:Uncharacterized protein n=1 Tax=Mycena venus TaxID=2733690 RepID=A0A8H6X6N3_9AGAR|nr:hypothetical protein MVEN_02205800 [Mycena venus]